RTHVTLSSKHAFQACAFSHSAISPMNFWEARQLHYVCGAARTGTWKFSVVPASLDPFYGRALMSANQQSIPAVSHEIALGRSHYGVNRTVKVRKAGENTTGW
ncbi:MAG: hypothetical protein WBW57_16195, partial [Candidatus Sulfotelmatobacter sp.]